jgi:hypothetical protein
MVKEKGQFSFLGIAFPFGSSLSFSLVMQRGTLRWTWDLL